MSDYYMKIDEHTPLLFKALIKYGSFKQKYFAEQLGISEGQLSSYLGGKKEMPKKLCNDLLGLLGFNPDNPYIHITTKIKLINK